MMKAVLSGIPKSSENFDKTAREKSCLGPTDFLLKKNVTSFLGPLM